MGSCLELVFLGAKAEVGEDGLGEGGRGEPRQRSLRCVSRAGTDRPLSAAHGRRLFIVGTHHPRLLFLLGLFFFFFFFPVLAFSPAPVFRSLFPLLGAPPASDGQALDHQQPVASLSRNYVTGYRGWDGGQ